MEFSQKKEQLCKGFQFVFVLEVRKKTSGTLVYKTEGFSKYYPFQSLLWTISHAVSRHDFQEQPFKFCLGGSFAGNQILRRVHK